MQPTDFMHYWVKKMGKNVGNAEKTLVSGLESGKDYVSARALRKKDAETIRLEIQRKINQAGELTILSLDEMQELIK